MVIFFHIFPLDLPWHNPYPLLNDLYDEHSELTLDDVGPLSHYWMILKYTVIYPGVEIDTFEVAPCKMGEDSAVYIVKDSKQCSPVFNQRPWSVELFVLFHW